MYFIVLRSKKCSICLLSQHKCFPKAGRQYFSAVRMMGLVCIISCVGVCLVQVLHCKYSSKEFVIGHSE